MSEGSFYFLKKVKKYKKSSPPFSFSCVLCVECEKKNGSKMKTTESTWRPCVEVGLALLGLFRVMDAEDFAVDLEKHSRTLLRIRISFPLFPLWRILTFWKKERNDYFCLLFFFKRTADFWVRVTQDCSGWWWWLECVIVRGSRLFLFFPHFPERIFQIGCPFLVIIWWSGLNVDWLCAWCLYVCVCPLLAPRCSIHSLFTKEKERKKK